MRRIPRPSRAIDPSAPLRSSVRPRISPSPAPCCTHFRTSTATFSSTPAPAFLLTGKPDKKKHQQFVRKWQKRLLGESEPIGAHVDPYDPTSPVRIAPEEQGDYEEVLEEADRSARRKMKRNQVGFDEDDVTASTRPFQLYVPAEDIGDARWDLKLSHVGGEEWLQQKKEVDMAKEFEKLTMRTYTPLTLGMASEIEDLTGTPYTLRDSNLMLAQTVHQETGLPYTKYNFGLRQRGRASGSERAKMLHARFVQAIKEVYALKEAGVDMDLAKLPNRGIYKVPGWVKHVELRMGKGGELTLAYPKGKSAEHFLMAMRDLPEWDLEAAADRADDLLAEEGELLEPVLPQEAIPTMDPATPAFKRAAMVKSDGENKPFDFMSNRPVPRVKPAEVAVVQEALETVVGPDTPSSRLTEFMTAFETSQSAVNGLRHTVLEHRAQRIFDDIAALRVSAPQKKSSSSSSAAAADRFKWRPVPITDVAVKFALFKRIYQLTRHRISDPHLASTKTLGDLYQHLCDAARPHATSLYGAIHLEGNARAARRAQSLEATSKRKPDLGDLISLGNVQLCRTKPDKREKLKKTGMQKVINYALHERGLTRSQLYRHDAKPSTKLPKVPKAQAGTRAMPEFGRPVSRKSADLLSEWTKEELEVVKE